MLYISFLFKDKIVFIYTFSKKTGIYNIQTYIRTKHICIILEKKYRRELENVTSKTMNKWKLK